MKTTYAIPLDDDFKKIANETYAEILEWVKRRNPHADQIVDDDEICTLHDLLTLIRLGWIKIGQYERVDSNHDELNEVILFEVRDPQ